MQIGSGLVAVVLAQVEALRPMGLQLLGSVLAKFGAAQDPLMPGHALLEQFQAQFVSALRYVWVTLLPSMPTIPTKGGLSRQACTSPCQRR